MKIIKEIPGSTTRYLVEATKGELARLEGFDSYFARHAVVGSAPFTVGTEIDIAAMYKSRVREMLSTLEDLQAALLWAAI